MQGVISQFAIPVLESQTVWVSGSPTPIAYMNTQDMARFAVAALEREETVRQAFPVVGPRAWTTSEITQLCERFTGKEARTFRVPPALLAKLPPSVQLPSDATLSANKNPACSAACCTC